MAKVVLAGLGLLWAQGVGRGEEAKGGLERLLEAVVRIDVWEVTFAGGAKRTTHGVGSGVILTPEGHILTNAHVVSPKEEQIRVTLANLERVSARLVGWDHWTDLAVIQLDGEEMARRGLVFQWAEFGDSEALFPGQPVYAVGTPNGLSRTVTRGIVSNTNRYFEGTLGFGGYETGYFNTWLQTDAAINPGNSGGPLVTERGEVIGINTRGYLGANNLGFAVPGNKAREIMGRLMAEGKVERSYVGIKLAPLQDLEGFFNLQMNEGALINSVDPGSPAAKAGLRAGDIILAIEGQPVDGRFPEQLPAIQQRIAQTAVGEAVGMAVKRGESRLEVKVATEALESRVGEEYAFEKWGLSVQEVSRAIAREQQLGSETGVLVLGMQPAFPAARAGVQPGDVILKVNRQPLEDLQQMISLYETNLEQPGKVLLEISRNHQISYNVMQPE